MNSPKNILPTAARTFGPQMALRTATRALTYTDLDELSDAAARGLVEAGITLGQTVSIYSQNCWEWVVAYHGILKAGAVVNPINIMLTAEELEYVLADSESRLIFVDAEGVDRAAAATADLETVVITMNGATLAGATGFVDVLDEYRGQSVEPHPSDGAEPCTIGYTSGTTGRPKGAVQSHQAVYLNCAHTATMHGRSTDDVVVTALPAPHVYGNVVINSTFLTGGTVVLMDRFDAEAALGLIAQERATAFEGVPTMYALLLASEALPTTDLSSLRWCTVGGQTMPEPTIERWQQVSGAPLLELWGMTEISGLGLTHTRHAPPRPGAAGLSLPGIQVKIADLETTGLEAPLGSRGELLVRGPVVMLGYYNDPDETARTIDPDGWLHTGDIAYLEPTGHVRIVDRLKDMIITGGYNIYPAEIERVLSSHPDVALVAVGPVPDDVRGELACAYVVPVADSNVTADELLAFAGRNLAAYKRPRLVRFVDDMPTTSSGKIMRRRLLDSRVNDAGTTS